MKLYSNKGTELKWLISGFIFLRKRLLLIYTIAFADVFCAHTFSIITRGENVQSTPPFQKLKFKRFMVHIPYSFIFFLSNRSVLNNNGLLIFLKFIAVMATVCIASI